MSQAAALMDRNTKEIQLLNFHLPVTKSPPKIDHSYKVHNNNITPSSLKTSAFVNFLNKGRSTNARIEEMNIRAQRGKTDTFVTSSLATI